MANLRGKITEQSVSDLFRKCFLNTVSGKHSLQCGVTHVLGPLLVNINLNVISKHILCTLLYVDMFLLNSNNNKKIHALFVRSFMY